MKDWKDPKFEQFVVDLHNKDRIKVKFSLGSSLEDAVNKLLSYKAKGILAYGEFNGRILYSDTVTMDNAYKELIGKTKSEFDKSQKDMKERLEKEDREHKEKIPALTQEWVKKGKEILNEDKWGKWEKVVPLRLSDLYRGMELGCCLEIIEVINNSGDFDDAAEKLNLQNHSGVSYGLVCTMIKEFCDKGSDFLKYIGFSKEEQS